MRFVVDSMLGTLARKLRIFGFDSLYYNNIDDDELLSISLSSDRVLLTSDKELFKRVISKNGRCILVNSNDEDNLVKISSYLGLRLKFILDNSRCPLCNEPLKRYDKIYLKELIPKKVYDTNDEFYLCSRCKKVYWKGSHIKRLLELEKRVNEKLANS
jgi:hypothetical protein